MHSISSLAISLAAIFVPIYLLNLGFSFKEVLVYILIQQLFAIVLQYPVCWLLKYIRPHHMMVVGVLGQVLLFGLLVTIQEHKWPLYLLSFAWAIERTAYWAAFHYVFAQARAHDKSGHQIAGLSALSTLAATVAPAIGGIMATVFGINYTYVIAITLLIISILPMLGSRKGPNKVSIIMPRLEILKMKKDATANFFNGIVLMSEGVVWPLFVFLIITTYAGVGILSSVIAVTSIIVTLYVGRKSDDGLGSKYLNRGLGTYSITSLARVWVQSTFQIFGLNLFAGLGRSLYVTPFLNKYYSNSDGQYQLGYISIMELAFSVGAFSYALVLLLLSFTFGIQTVLSIGLVIVAFGVLGVRLIR